MLEQGMGQKSGSASPSVSPLPNVDPQGSGSKPSLPAENKSRHLNPDTGEGLRPSFLLVTGADR